MATITLGGARGGTPGTFIYEDARATRTAAASFNTVYMCVDAPAEASVIRFPFNRPVFVSSLNEYENLIGELPTSGPELDSYFAVKAFFQQCTIGDLRVTRVGTPVNIVQIGFDPSANKDNGASAPSSLKKNDKVYIKLEINGIQLGSFTSSGAWLGVEVKIPVDYIVGNESNNLKISNAIRDAVEDAINANADISAGAYIRQTDNTGEISWLRITGRVFNAPVEVVNSNDITGNQYILSAAGYAISNVTEAEETVFDWIQTVRTAFNDPQLPAGYMTAPAAFKQYKKTQRVNLGQTMEEVCSDFLHKWMALVDCGPFDVTSINEYSEFIEHDPANGFGPGDESLVDNGIYLWTDTSPLRFSTANYEANNPAACANSLYTTGQRVGLKDDQQILVSVAANTTTDVITLAEDWPVAVLGTGTAIVFELGDNTPLPTPPLYTDTFTGITNEELLGGGFFVIANDVDTSLDINQIRVASSRTRAFANEAINLVTAGTPQGGVMLNVTYEDPAWKFNVEIKGKISDLVEAANGADPASFNTLHIPATFQNPTQTFEYKAITRQLTDPSEAITTGGLRTLYFNAGDVNATSDQILVPAHGFSTGDAITLTVIPSATAPGGLTSGNEYFVIVVDDNTIQLATSLANANAGTQQPISSTGVDSGTVLNPLGAPAQSLITIGGDCLFMVADHGLQTADRVFFDGDILSGTPDFLFRGTTDTATTVYFVDRVDRNIFRLARSSSDLASGAFVDFPTSGVATATSVRVYKKLSYAVAGGGFTDAGVQRFTRGRKYQMDVNLAVYGVRDEANVQIVNGQTDPYGTLYTADISTDVRLSYTDVPGTIDVYSVAAADVNAGTDTITITNHGYVTGTEVVVNTAALATLAGGLVDSVRYFVINTGTNTFKLAETAANAALGVAVPITSVGVDNAAGVEFTVTAASNPFTFAYTEDAIANPLNAAMDFAGDENFYCVPLSDGGDLYSDELTNTIPEVYIHTVLQIGTTFTPLYGAYILNEFLEPASEVPSVLWAWECVTSVDLINEALRGVNNGGVPQVKTLEVGMDNHSRLFAESQSYFTTQGFLAYYAPYIKNDVEYFIAPSSYVAGLAIRRYRDSAAGFRLPPAGVKYSLAGARGCQIQITSAQQEVSNPAGMNALRQLPGYSSIDPDTGEIFGPVFVWGSRTRVNRGNATQALYQFVNTRVILNVIYHTLKQAFDGQIFNVIDGRAVTFNQIRAIASNTLYEQFYVPGALFGATPADAFQVICDDRNNPPGNLDNGFVNVKIYVVPVPTLERIEIDLVRVGIGSIPEVLSQDGFA